MLNVLEFKLKIDSIIKMDNFSAQLSKMKTTLNKIKSEITTIQQVYIINNYKEK